MVCTGIAAGRLSGRLRDSDIMCTEAGKTYHIEKHDASNQDVAHEEERHVHLGLAPLEQAASIAQSQAPTCTDRL